MSASGRGKLVREQRVNRLLSIVIFGLVISHLGMGYLLYETSRPVLIDRPPDLTQYNRYRSNERFPHSIYGFAHMVFQHVNYWPWDGETDYEQKIFSVKSLVTPEFAQWLKLDFEKKRHGQNINELAGRTRTIQIASEEIYTPDNVRALGNGRWEVELILDIKDEIADYPIKHYRGRFVVTVVQYRVSSAENPWQLALHGPPNEVERLETYETAEKIGQVQ